MAMTAWNLTKLQGPMSNTLHHTFQLKIDLTIIPLSIAQQFVPSDFIYGKHCISNHDIYGNGNKGNEEKAK